MTTENGKEVTKDEIFEGTLEEVEKKLNAFESKIGEIHVDIKKDGDKVMKMIQVEVNEEK